MSTVGFIGLGIMGLPMAANLLAAGHDVVGYNRSKPKVDAFVARGGRGATSIAEVVADADVVITMLPDSPDVSAVVLGDGGVIASAPRDAVLIDMSTIDPGVSRQLDAAGKDAGIKVLDAPVSGGEQAAIDGALSIMVGGASADVEAAWPLLQALGTTIVHVGPAGAGQTVKAANQLIVAGNLELIAEAIVFLEAAGVETTPALQVLSGGLAGSTAMDRKGAGMLKRDFRPGFRIDLHHKDLGIAQSAARDAGLALPLLPVVSQLIGAARAQGLGDQDHSALLRLVEQLSGR